MRRSGRRAAIAAIAVAMLATCGSPPAQHPTPTPTPEHPGVLERGMASWYDEPQMTASGERFDPSQLTAAHRTLPFGTRVRVTNTRNGRSVIVRINDRGPFAKGRIIDLSKAAARTLQMIDAGVAPVELSRP